MTKNQEKTPWKQMPHHQKEAIRKAHAEGKKIQYAYVNGLGVWYDEEDFAPDEPPHNFLAYRIAPDQEPRSETRLAIAERQELVAKAVRWTLCTDKAVRSAGGSGASVVVDELSEDALYTLIANDLFILHLEGPDQ